MSPSRSSFWKIVRPLAAAALAIAFVWWRWPYVPDEVRTPPDVGWFGGPDEVRFSPNGERAVTIQDRRVCWFDLGRGALLSEFMLPEARPPGCELKERFLCVCFDFATGRRRVWNLENGTEVLPSEAIVSNLIDTPAGVVVLVKQENGFKAVRTDGSLDERLSAAIADVAGRASAHVIALPGVDVAALCFYAPAPSAPGGQEFRFFDHTTKKPLAAPEGFTPRFLSYVQISASGRWLACFNANGKLAVWDREKGTCTEHDIKATPGRDWYFRIAQDEEHIALSHQGGRVEWRRFPGLEPLADLQLDLPPNGYASGRDLLGQTKYWLTTEGAPTQGFAELRRWLERRNIRLLIFSWRNRLRLWRGSEPIAEFPSASFHGMTDDGRLMTVEDQSLSLWSLPPARPWLRSAVVGLGTAAVWLVLEKVWRWRRRRVPALS